MENKILTNEEKAKQLYRKYRETDFARESAAFNAAMEMAEWKDEQFSIERKQLIEKANQAVTQSFENGAIFADKTMIDKAVEWLMAHVNDYIVNDNCGGKHRDWFKVTSECFADFRKAMEE